jgi:hypothetical protein
LFLKRSVLVANQGGYTLTGQAALFRKASKMTAAQGSYSLTGQSAAFLKASVLTAVQGSYTLNGQAVTLDYSGAGAPDYTLTANQGSYTLTGQAATLTKQSKMTAAQGSYSLTGQAALFLKASKLTADQGSYTLTGQTVTLTYTPVSGAYTLTAETGYYALTGRPAALTYSGSDVVQPPSHGSRKGYRERKRFYDPERWLREWQKTEEELRADIEAIEVAQVAAREAAQAGTAKKQRKLKVDALERSLKSLDLETEQLRSELLSYKSAAYAKELAGIQSGLEAMMEDARAAEQTLLRLRRDEEAMAFLLLAEI